MPRALRTHHVFGVSNRNCGGQALVRMEFPASGESPSSKAYIPPLPVFILGKKKKKTLPDQGGISFSRRPTRSLQTTMNDTDLSGGRQVVPTLGWL